MRSALRILVLANFPPHVMGGAENQVERLVRGWLAEGSHVEVAGYAIPEGEQRLAEGTVRTHRLRHLPGLGRAGRGLGYALSLASLLIRRHRDFDVIYCRSLGDGALVVSLLKAVGLVDTPVLAVPINAGGRGDAWFLRSVPFSGLWVGILNRQLNAINLINMEVARELDELGITRPRRTTIPNGVEIGPEILRIDSRPVRRLVWSGRMEWQKGLDLLMPELAKLLSRGNKFHLTLCGDGPLQAALEDQASRLGLADHVVFRGRLDGHGIRKALADADAFVLPSRYEGMSNSVLEAMEASLPVLCTRCGGIDLWVDDGAGWTCRPGDPADLARALTSMFAASSEDWLARGRRARAVVEAAFDIEPIARANLELMSSLCRGRRS